MKFFYLVRSSFNDRPSNFYHYRKQYKCGVFYKNLPGRVDPNGNFEPLTFIGSLPDVLNKPKIQNSAEIRETFGDLKKKQFRIPKDCEAGKGPTVGNARCYAAVSFLLTLVIFCLIGDLKI